MALAQTELQPREVQLVRGIRNDLQDLTMYVEELDNILEGRPAGVPAVARRPLNPSFDNCKCGWGRAVWEENLARETDHGQAHSYASIENGQRLHESLLGLEGPDPLGAVVDLLSHLHDSCVPHDRGFDGIVAQHNWRDPVAMVDVALTIDMVWNGFMRSARLS